MACSPGPPPSADIVPGIEQVLAPPSPSLEPTGSALLPTVLLNFFSVFNQHSFYSQQTSLLAPCLLERLPSSPGVHPLSQRCSGSDLPTVGLSSLPQCHGPVIPHPIFQVDCQNLSIDLLRPGTPVGEWAESGQSVCLAWGLRILFRSFDVALACSCPQVCSPSLLPCT